QGLVRGLPKLKFEKDHLCSACAMGKSKKKSHKPKSEDTNQEKLYLLHMDLCEPMRAKSVNKKKYILVIIDDYSRFIWVKCLRLASLMKHQLLALHSKMVSLKDRQWLPHVTPKINPLHDFDTTRHHMSFYMANFLIYRSFMYLVHSAIQLMTVKIRKVTTEGCIGIFIGYALTKKAFRIYNRCTRRIIETIHVDFDELTAMAFEQSSLGPALHEMTPATISSRFVPNPTSSTPFVPPSRNDWDLLFQPLFDELLTPPPSVDPPSHAVIAPIAEVIALKLVESTGSSSSTTVDQDAQSPIAHMGNDSFFGMPIPKVASDQSSSTDSTHTILHPDHQISQHNSKGTKDHPLENIIGQLARPVSTRLQLHEQALFCYYDAFDLEGRGVQMTDVHVPVMTTVETLLLSAPTLPPPSISIISQGNKSIYRSDEQRNLYKALVDSYECDKIILDTYRDTVTLKRRHDDEDKDEEPFAGSDRRSKKRRAGKEPYESALAEEPMHTTLDKPLHQEFETGADDDQPISNLAKQADSRTSFNELMDTSVDFLAFLMNRLKVDTLTPELLAGLTYELMKGSCKSLMELEFFLEEVYKVTTNQLDWNNPEGKHYPHNLLKPLPLIPNYRGRCVIPFDHFINNDLEYLCGGASIQKYTTSITKTKAADYRHIKWIEDLFYGFAINRESARDVYSKHRIISITELHIVEWHNYKHLDLITVHRDDDKLYKFKEGDFKRLRIQDTEDMLLLLVQGKLTNLTVNERFAFNRNLTKPDTYRTYLKRKEAYTAYSNPRGFIYQNKDKKNRLMRIDELHKFSDGMLNDVQTTLDDRLKLIWMKYLPQTIWRRSDKERAAAMIQAIDKQLKTRRIMRSLEEFVGGRLYEGDFRMLQRTI
nr:integrase, catalytic region, zinc finger, CCHC-type, peptidase aspartic, catalytic [Tanacetum cinerariifolium]